MVECKTYLPGTTSWVHLSWHDLGATAGAVVTLTMNAAG